MSRPFPPVVAPPLEEQQGATFPRAVELMQRLLAPDGCPWDREQSFASLRRFVIEEACEVVDAIDDGVALAPRVQRRQVVVHQAVERDVRERTGEEARRVQSHSRRQAAKGAAIQGISQRRPASHRTKLCLVRLPDPAFIQACRFNYGDGVRRTIEGGSPAIGQSHGKSVKSLCQRHSADNTARQIEADAAGRCAGD